MIRTFLKTILWALLIAVLSLLPASSLDGSLFPMIPSFDKWVHAILYFILTIFFLYELLACRKTLRRFFILLLIPLGYGILMEILQELFTAQRSGDYMDVLANAMGIALAWFLFVRLGKDKLSKS